MPYNIAKFSLSGTQVATWTKLLLKIKTDGRCMAAYEGKRSEQTTWWKLPFPTMKIRTERRLSQNSCDLSSSWGDINERYQLCVPNVFHNQDEYIVQAFSILCSWIRCTFF